MLAATQSLIMTVLAVGLFLVTAWALIDCMTRPAEAFRAADRLTKRAWLAITAAAAVAGVFAYPLGILGLAAIVAALVYLLDVRPRIIEVLSWRQ